MPTRERQPWPVASILGPEGSGKTQTAQAISYVVNECSHYDSTLINIPYWFGVDTSKDKAKFVLDWFSRELGHNLHIELASTSEPNKSFVGALRARIGDGQSTSELKHVIILNGVCRIPHSVWPEFNDILVELANPGSGYVLIMLTSRSERASGFIQRIEAFDQDAELEVDITRCWRLIGDITPDGVRVVREKLDPTEWPVPDPAPVVSRREHVKFLKDGMRLEFDADKPSNFIGEIAEVDKKSEFDESQYALKSIKNDIKQHAVHSRSLARFTSHLLYYIEFPNILLRFGIDDSVKPNDLTDDKIDRIVQSLEIELACFMLPRALVAHPKAVLERLAAYYLAGLSTEDRRALRVLAEMAGPLTRAVIDSVKPGMFELIREYDAIRVAFRMNRFRKEDPVSLFPEIQQAILDKSDEDIEAVYRDVSERRFILTQHFYRSGHGREGSAAAGGRPAATNDEQVKSGGTTPTDSICDWLLHRDLGRIDFGRGCFARLVNELFWPLERATFGLSNRVELTLLNRLLSTDDSTAVTNLSLLTRARLDCLKGRVAHLEAGRDWARANPGIDRIKSAYWVADNFRVTEKICQNRSNEGDRFLDGLLEDFHDVERVCDYTLTAWREARLRLRGCYEAWFGLNERPRASDVHWEPAEREESEKDARAPTEKNARMPGEVWDALSNRAEPSGDDVADPYARFVWVQVCRVKALELLAAAFSSDQQSDFDRARTFFDQSIALTDESFLSWHYRCQIEATLGLTDSSAKESEMGPIRHRLNDESRPISNRTGLRSYLEFLKFARSSENRGSADFRDQSALKQEISRLADTVLIEIIDECNKRYEDSGQ